MKTITWDLEDAPIKFPKEVRSIFDKVFIHNLITYKDILIYETKCI